MNATNNANSNRKTARLLGVIVVMQALTLVGQWTGVPSVAPAQAQIPDPGARQMQMIDELKQLNSKLDRLVSVLEGGQLEVKVRRDDEDGDNK